MVLENLLKLKNIGGELSQIYQSVDGGFRTSVFGCEIGARAHISAGLDKFILYVCEDKIYARKAYELLEDYFGDKVVYLAENDDLLIHRKAHRQSPERIKAIAPLAKGEARACVVSSESLLQYLPKKQNLLSKIFTIQKNQDYKIDSILENLVALGYVRQDEIEGRGEFSRVGDILSIFPINTDMPIRVSFFDETVEYIKVFQPESMMSISEIESVEILPASDILLPFGLEEKVKATLEKLIKTLPTDAKIRAEEITSDVEFRLQTNPCDASLVWAIPFIKENLSTIFDYLPQNTVVVFDEIKNVETRIKLYLNEHKSRVKALSEQGEVLKAHEKSLLDEKDAFKAVLNFGLLAFQQLTSINGIFDAERIFNLKLSPLTPYHLNYNALTSDIKRFLQAERRVVLCCGDEQTAQAFADSLKKEDINAVVREDFEKDFRGVATTSVCIKKGFNYAKQNLVVIGRDELLKRRTQSKVSTKKREVFSMPKCGDYVVHDYHGVGLCVGIERIKNSQGEKDYVVVNYKDGKLYVPTDQMAVLQRYGGSDKEPKLNKLGGQEFSQIKEKVKQAIREMAFDLLELYKKRENSKGFKYSQDNELQTLFEDAFEFQETNDQIEAIAEIKSDMESGKVMDRLLCGDVGYGKTEVALRAIFKTVVEKKQAALLCPTTILAKQHFNTAQARFKEFGIRVVLLSRFQSPAEIKASLRAVEKGEADVVIATHRLLSKDVHFKDLGLLVLDEEQRFGVEDKEKIKLLKSNINVLTLSATPIPRTLNMALSGIRDISVLATPPSTRIPVQTYVTELTDGLLKDVIKREIARGGQVFALYNRVQGIEKFAEHIRDLVEEAVVIVGHGQMENDRLERSINAFYNKEGNVFVCTTIIENGIDLPDANTLIVCEADKLGLSALYQLRGRVGRSDKLAHAYFTVKEDRVMTENAKKRLTAIMDYTDFGSGFKIAMRDLEIRGAGNVLGREQHGHIAKVGYDMYCRLLQEAVDEMNGEAVVSNRNTEIIVDIDAYLEDGYVKNTDNKLRIYKEIAEVSSEEARLSLLENLKETYGKPPRAVENLLKVSLIKNLASKIDAKKVVINSNGAGIIFENGDCFKNSNLLFAVGEMSDDCVLSATKPPTVVFNAKFLSNEKKIELVLKFLQKTSSNF